MNKHTGKVRRDAKVKKILPDFEQIISIAACVFMTSVIIGDPVISWFNQVNPWLILEKPTLTGFIFFAFIAIYIRRTFFNYAF